MKEHFEAAIAYIKHDLECTKEYGFEIGTKYYQGYIRALSNHHLIDFDEWQELMRLMDIEVSKYK